MRKAALSACLLLLFCGIVVSADTDLPGLKQNQGLKQENSEVADVRLETAQVAAPANPSQSSISFGAGDHVPAAADGLPSSAEPQHPHSEAGTDQEHATEDASGLKTGQQQQAAIQDATAEHSGAAAEQAAPAVPAAAVPPIPAIAHLNLNSSSLRQRLEDAQHMLFNASRRNLPSALHSLQEISSIVAAAVPASRRRLLDPAAAAAAAPGSTDSPETTGAAVVTSAAIPAPGPGTTLLKAREFNGTGVDTAAQALFTLAALQAHRLLGPEQGLVPGAHAPPASAAAVVGLHQAAMAGSREAMLALADRYATGAGVSYNETMALIYSRLAAYWLIEEVEASQQFAAPMAPIDMRQAWIDQRYVSPDEAENAERVLAMEEDMAMRGNVEAQRRLAYRRLLGRGLEADPEGAFRDFEAGAAQGDAYAMFNLGYMHLRGMVPLGIVANISKAKELFEAAAEKNLPSAWSGLGSMYWTGQVGEANLTLAFEAYLKGAALNNSDSLYNLGVMWTHGLGTERNETRALEMYLLAEEFGHWKAAFTLGSMYESGIGVERNITKALYYFRKLFKDRASWTNLVGAAAKAFDDGDDFGAMSQMIIAAEQGSDAAAINAAWMLQRRLGYKGPRALDLAARLYERAAKQGSPSAAVELGHLVYHADELGLSRPRNLSEVFHWYQSAAASNSTEGLYYLAWAHHHGCGTARNVTAAAELYRRSIKSAGSFVAQMPRMVAPTLGLASLWLDGVLEPLMGSDATYRAALHVQRALRLRPPERWALRSGVWREGPGTGQSRPEAAVGGDSEGNPARHQDSEAWVPVAAVIKAVTWLQHGLTQLSKVELTSEQVDHLLLTILFGSLAMVLALRHRQRLQAQTAAAGRAAAPQGGMAQGYGRQADDGL